MMKLLYEIIISPLGLPIDWYLEYIILMSIGSLTHYLAFGKVRKM